MFNIFRKSREEKERAIRALEVQKILKEKELQAEASALFLHKMKEASRAELKRKINSQFIDPVASAGETMDSCGINSLTPEYSNGMNLPPAVYDWYASQGFIGYQACSIIAQHWLVDKCCRMPADDAVRGGCEIVAEDQRVIDLLVDFNKKIKLNQSMQEYINFGRVFGIRIAIFIIDTTDPEFYEKPFNIDSVTPNSYKGISQVDPYWVIPELTAETLSNPASLNFYNPTYYTINGKRYHKSHLCVYTPYPVPDNLKPFYRYGGKSMPQMIFNRVYASERTADEAPQLAMAKRMIALQLEDSALGNTEALQQRLDEWSLLMNNYGIKALGQGEAISLFDTSLADFDNLTMTEYQLVASVSEVPATKLLGTQPKGFNSTGDYELQNYWQLLNGIRENELTPLAERSNEIAMRSYVAPKLGMSAEDIEQVKIEFKWGALDSPTEEKRALINKTKADTAAAYHQAGAIDGEDIRISLNKDKNSDFYGVAENDEETSFNEETDEVGSSEEGATNI